MSEPKSIPHVTTTPKPFGVNVEWKWPEVSHQLSQLELQYLFDDGRLVSESFMWPVAEKHISGLKTGERLQIRLRPIALDGSARDWRASDWIEGVSSVDAEEIIEALTEEIRNSCALHGLEGGWFVDKTGKAYINEALIGDGKLSANYSVKVNGDNSKHHAAGMAIGVEGERPKVVFQADQFKVRESASAIIKNSVAINIKAKTVLSDEMKKAIIDAVRESDLFTALQVNIDAQTASVADLKQAVNEAVTNAIKNALKPGGLLYNR